MNIFFALSVLTKEYKKKSEILLHRLSRTVRGSKIGIDSLFMVKDETSVVPPSFHTTYAVLDPITGRHLIE